MLRLIMVIGFPENSLTSPLVIKRSVVGIPEAMEGSGGKEEDLEGKREGWEGVEEGLREKMNKRKLGVMLTEGRWMGRK